MSRSDVSVGGVDNPGFADVQDAEKAKYPVKPGHGQDADDDETPPPENCFSTAVSSIQSKIGDFFQKNRLHFGRFIKILILIGYLCYFAYAMYYSFSDEGSIRLLVITVLVLAALAYKVATHFFSDTCSRLRKKTFSCRVDPEKKKKVRTIIWIVLLILLLIALIIFLIMEVILKETYNLISFLGLVIYVLLCFVFSYSPAHVRWRPVIGGLVLQFILALFILRTRIGFQVFKWMGDRVAEFLKHSDEGAKFMFGSLWDKAFAFSVLPVIIFFCTAISVAYYLGVMQVVILKVAYVMQVMMGTTAAESVNAAANIFIGQSEAPLVIRPLIKDMTRSELHAVMTGGFATIAGSVMAAYISFGIAANHLIGASVMSAPAALAISKLFYPETQKSKTTTENIVNLLEKGPEGNLLEAASNGASASVKLVANISVNLMAFLSMLKFVNETLGWVGDRVGVEELTFGLICSYVFYPLALIMGIKPVDCRKVAELLGIKTFLNEFIAYKELGVVLNNKAELVAHVASNGTFSVNSLGDYILSGSGKVLVGGVLEERSEVIATYALCGFANFGSMGIVLATLGVLAPHKKPDLSKIVLRAMIAGNVACFMTACIAGLMYEPSIK